MELNQDLIEEGRALVVKTEAAERMTSEGRLALGRWAEKCVAQRSGQGARNDLTSGPTVPEVDLLGAYAGEIGVARETLRKYRDVAIAWGDAPADGLSWGVIRRLAYRTDREEYSRLVFEKYGKVTEYTIQMYEAFKAERQKQQEQILQPVFTDEVIEGEEDWDEEEETEQEFIYDPVNPPLNTQPRKHGFSGPIRKLFAVVEHVRAAKALIVEESIPSVDYANDEHFEEILSACDTIVTEIMDYREMVVAKRVKAGLSPEVG